MTRVHRGSGLCIKFSGPAKLPRKWNDFLRDARNVKELFDLLTDKLRSMRVLENKEAFVSSGDDVISIGTEHVMPQCNHEEADTRIIIHVKDSLQESNTIMVRTVILMSLSYLLDIYILCFSNMQVLIYWWPLEQVKISVTTISTQSVQICVERGWALPPFHAFTGCDTTSSFFAKSKKSAWQALNAYPEATKAFIYIQYSTSNGKKSRHVKIKTLAQGKIHPTLQRQILTSSIKNKTNSFISHSFQILLNA